MLSFLSIISIFFSVLLYLIFYFSGDGGNDLLGLFHFFLVIILSFCLRCWVISLISGMPLARLEVNWGDSSFYQLHRMEY